MTVLLLVKLVLYSVEEEGARGNHRQAPTTAFKGLGESVFIPCDDTRVIVIGDAAYSITPTGGIRANIPVRDSCC